MRGRVRIRVSLRRRNLHLRNLRNVTAFKSSWSINDRSVPLHHYIDAVLVIEVSDDVEVSEQGLD